MSFCNEWDSWQKPCTQSQPVGWHHDIFHADGKPRRPAEVEQIRAETTVAQKDSLQGSGKRR